MSDQQKNTNWGKEHNLSESKGFHMVSSNEIRPAKNAVSSSENEEAINDLEDFDG